LKRGTKKFSNIEAKFFFSVKRNVIYIFFNSKTAIEPVLETSCALFWCGTGMHISTSQGELWSWAFCKHCNVARVNDPVDCFSQDGIFNSLEYTKKNICSK
jgi:hypothetical protein